MLQLILTPPTAPQGAQTPYTAWGAAGHQPTFMMGTVGWGQDSQAVAPGDVWALMTTALPTFIPTHPCQETESGQKTGKEEEKKN